MSIYVVIPNWNEADLLEKCLLSLSKQSIRHSVVVVDNGSVDNSLEIIKKFPKVHLIKNPKNLGFTGGVNPGIKYALQNGAESIALLNNDAVVDEKWLESLASGLKKNKKTGIVTSKILRINRKYLDSTGEFYSIYGIPFPRGRNEFDKNQFDNKTTIFAASGGASLYRSEMLLEIGLFDDRFFAYYEDVDLSFRAQLAGWRVIYQPDAKAYHSVGATSSKMGDFARYHSIKNFLILYTKDMPGYLYFKYLPYFLYQFTRTIISSITKGQIIILFRAYTKFLVLLPGIVKDRIIIQSRKKVSIRHIDQMLYKTKPSKAPKISH